MFPKFSFRTHLNLLEMITRTILYSQNTSHLTRSDERNTYLAYASRWLLSHFVQALHCIVSTFLTQSTSLNNSPTLHYHHQFVRSSTHNLIKLSLQTLNFLVTLLLSAADTSYGGLSYTVGSVR